MSENNNISDLLKDKRITFSEEELNKIIDVELKKGEKEQNTELIELCLSLINDKKDAQSNQSSSKKKLSFRFISLIVTIVVLLFALVPVFLRFTSSRNSHDEPLTETTSTQITTSEMSVATTQLPTDPVSDPTKVSTTVRTDVFINFLYEPEKIIFYHDGKTQTITKGDVMCDEVIKTINKATKNDNWGILKLAVEEDYIEKIKNENLCIEIFYDDIQLLNDLNGHTLDEYNFEKVLIVLDGDNKNTMFFCKNGKYQNGPIRPHNSALSEEVLSYIFD